jgi:hypothetical protein
MSEDLDMWAEFGMRPDTMSTEELLQILDSTKNPHSHRHKDLAALKGSVKAVGFKNVICLWKDPTTGKTEVVYGGGRILTGADENLPRLPIVWALDLDKAKAKLLRIADNRVKDLSTTYDDQILIEDLKELKFDGFDYDFLKLEKYDKLLVDDFAADDPLFADLAPGYAERVNGPARKVDDALGPVQPLPLGSGELELHPPLPKIEPLKNGDSQKGDLMFPCEPEFGVPVLSLKYQAEKVPKPVVKWGEVSRKSKVMQGGVIHFYVEDSKFEQLYYNDPNAPLYSGAYACVLPNFSIRTQTPRSWLLGQTFKKYWLGRYWQSKGMRIFVDLNVRLDRWDDNMLGCPKTWQAYALRGYNAALEHIEECYKMACKWAESDNIIFLVIGGGHDVQEKAAQMQWTWIPERMDVVKFPNLDDGLQPKVKLTD